MNLRRLAIFATLSLTFSAIFGQTAIAQFTQIFAIEGQNAPDGNGVFSGFDGNPVINNAGQVGFTGFLTNTEDPPNDDRGIFISDGTSIVQIAREGNLFRVAMDCSQAWLCQL